MSTRVRFAVTIEKGDGSFGAYVPDLPGCVAVGETKQETLHLIQEAIELHLESLRQDGERPPEPSSGIEYVEVVLT